MNVFFSEYGLVALLTGYIIPKIIPFDKVIIHCTIGSSVFFWKQWDHKVTTVIE